jgi:penicillin-binding protein-related factor A (putative recombinase)
MYGSGRPDLIGCYRGRAFAFEVKVPGGKPTELQLKQLKEWADSGAISAVVYSVDDVKRALNG